MHIDPYGHLAAHKALTQVAEDRIRIARERDAREPDDDPDK